MAADRDVPPAPPLGVSASDRSAPTGASRAGRPSQPSVASADDPTLAPRAVVPGSELAVWLAGPAARRFFAPEAQSADDLTRWRDIVNTRKREEWEISRALLAHVRSELGDRGRAARTRGARSDERAASDETSLRAARNETVSPAASDEIASGAASGAKASRAARDETVSDAVSPAASDEAVLGTASGETASRAARCETASPAAGVAPPVRAHSSAPLAPEGAALSLSHSGGYAAAAASRAATSIGVDLECERPRDLKRIARFAFAESENAQLEALKTPAERVERFYILWTLKEAFAKALALPLLASLRQCTFSESAGAWRASVPTKQAWVARAYRASPTLVLSVVALLPESVSPADFRISTREWPAPALEPWRTLIALASADDLRAWLAVDARRRARTPDRRT